MENISIYENIGKRTGGDIYIGVVGPVRAGKSTFIKRFMDLMVIPNVNNTYERQRILDEMPQSGTGRTDNDDGAQIHPGGSSQAGTGRECEPQDKDGRLCRIHGTGSYGAYGGWGGQNGVDAVERRAYPL